jgi:hypothetical protein
VATRPPPERGEVWPIILRKKGNFRQKLDAVLPFGDFSPKKKMSASGTLPGGILERTSVFSQPDRLKLVRGIVLRIL